MAHRPKAVIDKIRVSVVERSKTQNKEDRDDRGAKKADSRIEQMQRRGLLSPPMTLSPSTVYRLLHGQHLMHPAVVRTDRRKFEAECVNDR